MALKGTTRIELTNVKTGQKEVIEKDNLVTNAVADVLGLNPFNALCTTGTKGPAALHNNRFPLCPNLFGGILLYENALEEDAAKYYAPYNNPLVGYSSNNVNSTIDTRRGSMNLTESGILDDESGYRFVFDFTTNQANGTISALGLTSKWGGLGGYKSSQQYYSSRQYLGGFALDYSGHLKALFGNIYRLDPDTGIAYACQLTADNYISVAKFQLNLQTTRLVGNTVSSKVIEENSIVTEVFGKYGSNTNYAFLSDGDGYIWGFQHAGNKNGNSSGNATITWIKINPEDWTFEEGTWDLPLQLQPFGRILQNNVLNAEYSGGSTYSIIKDGFLFCFSYDWKTIYKIQLNNISNVKELKRENGGAMATNWPGTGNWSSSLFCEIGNAIITPYCSIVNDVVYESGDWSLNISDFAWQVLGCCTSLKVGPYALALAGYGGSGYSDQAYVSLVTPYLATINNLPTPVQKTADKTMKITYILREEM